MSLHQTLPPLTTATSIPARFHEVVRHVPDNPAILDGNQTVTYTQLDTWSDSIAQQLRDRAGSAPQPIVLYFGQGAVVIAAMLGVLKAGFIYSVLDPALPKKRTQTLLDNLGASYALMLVDAVPDFSSHFPDINIMVCDAAPQPALTRRGVEFLSPNALASIYYTSGTTSTPKGVMFDHEVMMHRIWQDGQVYPVKPGDVAAAFFAPAFASSVSDVFGTLLNGATVAIYLLNHQGVSNLHTWLIKNRVTMLHIQAGALRELLNALPDEICFSHLQFVRPSGKMPAGDIRRLQKHLPSTAIIVHVLTSSETWPVSRFVIRPNTNLSWEIMPVGQPVSTAQISLVGKDDQPVPDGEPGEVVVHSRYLARGYWRQPELTAQRFQTDPNDARYSIYRMGDIARKRPDGELELVGRTDHQVKIRGYTVNLDAVDRALYSLPFVQEAVTLVHPTQNGVTLVSYVGLAVDAIRVTPSLVRELLAPSLPDYMIPARFIFRESLPLLSNGKIDRAALPPPGKERPQLEAPFIAPRTNLERQLVAIWAELLDLDEVGVNDDFFELGGDSLMAMRLVLQVENQLDYQVSPDFFRQPTIAHLAQLITGEGKEPATNLIPAIKTNQKSRLRYRLLRQSIGGGPVWRGHPLPYGLGVRLQPYWLKLPLIQRRMQADYVVLDHWLALVGRDDPTGREKQLSMLANTWRRWREVCLWQPETYRCWVSVKGWDNLDSAQETGRPIIIVGTHTAIKSAAMKMAVQQRTGRPVWTLGYSPTGQVDAIAKVIVAQRLISEGGIVHITGDGAQGNTGLELPFFNRFWLFRTGGAELALDTNALLLPVFNTLSHSGHITVEFLPPFITLAQDKKAQVEELTRQYADLLADRWPNLLSNMKWDKLQQIYKYGLKNAG